MRHGKRSRQNWMGPVPAVFKGWPFTGMCRCWAQAWTPQPGSRLFGPRSNQSHDHDFLRLRHSPGSMGNTRFIGFNSSSQIESRRFTRLVATLPGRLDWAGGLDLPRCDACFSRRRWGSNEMRREATNTQSLHERLNWNQVNRACRSLGLLALDGHHPRYI